MFEKVIQEKGNKFYSINENTIQVAQNEMGIIFPYELVEFYKQVGYGFLKSEEDNFNRIMDPMSVCEFRFRKGQFEYNSELEIYDVYERDKLIFFEICEGNYLSIGFAKTNRGEIFYGDTMIAKSLSDFLLKYQDDEDYFESTI